MPHTVQVRGVTDRDRWGNPMLGAPVEMRCLVTDGSEYLMRSDVSLDFSPKAVIYTDGSVPLSTDSVVTLPDGSRPPVMQVSRHPDEYGGIEAVVVFLGE